MKKVKEEPAQEPAEKQDFHKTSIAYKNKLFKYKDGSVARITYDGKDPHYIEVISSN